MDSKAKFKRPETTPANLPQDVDTWIQDAGTKPEASTATGAVERKGTEDPKDTKPNQHEQKMKRLTIDIPLSLHKRVKNGSTDRGMKMADVIRDLLEQEFPDPKRRK